MKGISIEERAIELAHYIIDSKDTVRGAAAKFGVSKSTVHKEVTLRNGLKFGQVIPESIEIFIMKEKQEVIRIMNYIIRLKVLRMNIDQKNLI